MSKGDRTKQSIVETSAQVFSQKGYAVVTMKDICEACKLSRGGLYRYFGSTKEIFLEILNTEKDNSKKELDKSIADKVAPAELFDAYLAQKKKDIAAGAKGFAFALHDFAFAEEDQKTLMSNRMKNAVKNLTTLLKYGQTKGFKKFDPDTMATHIAYFIDGLEASAPLLKLTDKQVTAQLALIREMVV